MSTIKNVVLIGTAGQLGGTIFKQVQASGKFNITIVSRAGSKSTFPAGTKVVAVDLTSLEALTSAFANQDAVVSIVGTEGLLGQTLLFDAAVAAGVKIFIPSEFGSDISNPLVAALPVFSHKIAVRKHIEAAISSGAAKNVTYTYVINSGFLDWGLEKGFLFTWAEGKPTLFDGGNARFSATLLSTIGDAVVGVLTHPKETANRSVYVEDIVVSQNQLLAIAQKLLPGKEWAPVSMQLDGLVKKSYEALAKGDFGTEAMLGFLAQSIHGGEKYNQPFAKNDNKLLGLKGISEAELEAIFKNIIDAAAN